MAPGLRAPRRRRARAHSAAVRAAIALGAGRVRASAATSPRDGAGRPGFFNYSDYEHSTLRSCASGSRRAVRGDRPAGVPGRGPDRELGARSQPVRALRARPALADRRFDLQAGRIPPMFGASRAAATATDNPLIGYPLAYQYLTTLRPDAGAGQRRRAAADARPRLARRLRRGNPSRRAGCRSSPRSAGTPACRCASAGDRARGQRGGHQGHAVEPARPRRQRRQAGPGARRTAAGRRARRRRLGARGAYLDAAALSRAARPARRTRSQQRASGVDLEYSRGHWLVRRGDGLERLDACRRRGRRRLARRCGALAVCVEGRYVRARRLRGGARRPPRLQRHHRLGQPDALGGAGLAPRGGGGY